MLLFCCDAFAFMRSNPTWRCEARVILKELTFNRCGRFAEVKENQVRAIAERAQPGSKSASSALNVTGDTCHYEEAEY